MPWYAYVLLAGWILNALIALLHLALGDKVERAWKSQGAPPVYAWAWVAIYTLVPWVLTVLVVASFIHGAISALPEISAMRREHRKRMQETEERIAESRRRTAEYTAKTEELRKCREEILRARAALDQALEEGLDPEEVLRRADAVERALAASHELLPPDT